MVKRKESEKIELGKMHHEWKLTGRKYCTDCNEEKPVEMFYVAGGGREGYRPKCKVCMHMDINLKTNNEEKRSEYIERKRIRAENYRRTAEYHKSDKTRDKVYRHKYGLTLEQVELEKKKQDNKCYVCGKEEKLFVDHCHKTEKYRKMLCCKCNSALGFVNEDLEILQKLKEYVIEHKEVPQPCNFCVKNCGKEYCHTNREKQEGEKHG